MKVIKVDYNLQNITQAPKAILSDLFMLLYSIYLLEEQGVKASRYTLNKLYPFVFQKLEEKKELNKIHIFNLPFYKFKGGHYNKSLSNKYLNKLLEKDLIEEIKEGEKNNYSLKSSIKKVMEDFHKELGEKEENKKFIALIKEYVDSFIRGKNYSQIYKALNDFSHNLLVEKGKKRIKVHDLPASENDDSAIAYNSLDFKRGKPSNLVPGEYLTLLTYMFQRVVKPTKASKIFVETLLQNTL